MQGDGLERADGVAFAVLDKVVELPPVPRKIGTDIEQGSKRFLDAHDLLADRQPAAQGRLQVGRGRQVIGMSVGLQLPDHLQTLGADVGDHGVGGAL
jgi:hypothetical protein